MRPEALGYICGTGALPPANGHDDDDDGGGGGGMMMTKEFGMWLMNAIGWNLESSTFSVAGTCVSHPASLK